MQNFRIALTRAYIVSSKKRTFFPVMIREILTRYNQKKKKKKGSIFI